MSRPGAVLALATLLASAPAAAQTAPPVPPPAGAPAATSMELSWSGSAELYLYLQKEGEFILPLVRADHGPLHLEGRYQYEDRKTFSGWMGWTFETGKSLRLKVTPMVGGLVGQTKGVAPGLELTLSWKSFSLYSEAEYVFDVEGSEGNFFYSWSELGWQATSWLTAGVAGQRTRLHETPRTLDWGIFAAAKAGPVTLRAYGFSLDSDEPLGVLSLAVDF